MEIDFTLPQKKVIVQEINGQAANVEYQTLNNPPQCFLGSYIIYFTFKNKYCMQHLADGAALIFLLYLYFAVSLLFWVVVCC